MVVRSLRGAVEAVRRCALIGSIPTITLFVFLEHFIVSGFDAGCWQRLRRREPLTLCKLGLCRVWWGVG
jgi:hypothetical protein